MKTESYDGRENNGVALPSGIADALAEAGFEQPGISMILTDEQRKILANIPQWHDYALEYQIAHERNTLLEQRIGELEQQLQQARAWSRAWKARAKYDWQRWHDWENSYKFVCDKRDASNATLAAMRAKIEEVRDYMDHDPLTGAGWQDEIRVREWLDSIRDAALIAEGRPVTAANERMAAMRADAALGAMIRQMPDGCELVRDRDMRNQAIWYVSNSGLIDYPNWQFNTPEEALKALKAAGNE